MEEVNTSKVSEGARRELKRCNKVQNVNEAIRRKFVFIFDRKFVMNLYLSIY